MPDFIVRQRWWLTRILLLPVHLFVFAIIAFLLLRLVPGDPVAGVLGPGYTHSSYLAMQKELGLDGSVWSQLRRYLGGLVTLNFGHSIKTGDLVITEIGQRLPGTIELAVQGLLCTVLLSLVLSYVAVFHPKNWFSRAVMVYSRAAGALPEFVLGVWGVFLFWAVLHIAPSPLGRLDTDLPTQTTITGFPFLDTLIQGYWQGAASMAAHLVLPIAVMAVAEAAVVVKYLVSGLQGAIVDPATSFRITTGAGRRATVLSVYRRAAPPVVTLIGQMFGYLIGGTIVLETIFGFAGLGQYAVQSVLATDYPAIEGFLLVVAAITLLVYMGVDLVVMSIDPRRRPGVVRST
ncbi:MAG: ABC transporter permease [Gordonia sp. (in: high G+C Gram-positive bacteria)]